MTFRKKVDVNPFNSITSILTLVLVFVGIYFIASWLFKILAWLAPIFLIITLVIDYRVVLNYGKWLYNLLLKNPIMGIGGILLTFFGFPVIAGFLLVKALLYRKVRDVKQQYETQTQGELIDYEEIEDESPIRLELPEVDKRSNKKNRDYDQFFS